MLADFEQFREHLEGLWIVYDVRNGRRERVVDVILPHPKATLVQGWARYGLVYLDRPFCEDIHTHGGFGHRCSHCSFARLPDREVKKHGYVIVPPDLYRLLVSLARSVSPAVALRAQLR